MRNLSRDTKINVFIRATMENRGGLPNIAKGSERVQKKRENTNFFLLVNAVIAPEPCTVL
jgi:hypothetical protein